MLDFANANLPQESTGVSPHMLEMGYEARMQFDWTERTLLDDVTLTEKMNCQEAQQYAKQIEGALTYAKDLLQQAQKRQQIQANKHRRAMDFELRDKVYVIKKGWRTDRPNDKLDYSLAGPWKILKQIGHSYKLEVPQGFQIHLVFSADRLRKDPGNPLPGQINDPEPPELVNKEQEWEVSEIIGLRMDHRKLQYRVQ